MKKTLILMALATLMGGTAAAQDDTMPQRGRIENVTDHTQPIISKTHRIGTRATAPMPCLGSPKVPVILVQFNDLKFTHPDSIADGEEAERYVHENYQKYCNGTGVEGLPYRLSNGSWGSVSDYFVAQSDSLFHPDFTVIGPVTLSKSYAYYGRDSGNTHDVNMGAFFSEACKQAVISQSVEWSDFDNNGDGTVDFVFFIYAGQGQNDTAYNDDDDTIWPKESTSARTITADGISVTFGGYGCTCELYRSGLDGIGTMCHELSHALGLPDLYDVAYNCYGMDFWDLMDSGCYQITGKQPCEYSAYERDFMGWRELKKVKKNEAVTLTLQPIEAGGNGYVVTNDGFNQGTEYFILENRQNIGFDTYLGCPAASVFRNYGACHGLLIVHVDYLQSAWTSNRVNAIQSHQRFTPVPADSTLVTSIDGYDEHYYLSFRGDIYPGNQGVTALSMNDVYNGQFTQTITNIRENEDGTVTVDINGGTPYDAIDDLAASTAARTPVGYYTLSGQQVSGLQRGVTIVRYSDGGQRKILSK